jgi:hypothetical protein
MHIDHQWKNRLWTICQTILLFHSPEVIVHANCITVNNTLFGVSYAVLQNGNVITSLLRWQIQKQQSAYNRYC